MDRRQDKLLKKLTEAYQQMEEGAADTLFGKDAMIQAETGIRKGLMWLARKLDDLLGYVDGSDVDKHRVKYNRNIIRKALSKAYSESDIDKIENIYRNTVLEVADQIGKSDNVVSMNYNFGKISFIEGTKTDFTQEDMAEIEARVRERLQDYV